MNINKKFKASVFSLLFSNPDTLRELYCALEGVTLPPDIPVTINTLDDVLFMDRINDISFEIGGKLVVLIEHQSSVNPNMAFRLLMYIARVYEKIIDGKKIYSTKPLALPRPEFFVLYNGKACYENETILKLSDLFESLSSLGLPEKESPALELVVKVININEGENREIAQKSRTLAQYSALIAKIAEYEEEGFNKAEAVKKAVNFCSKHDILKEFLERNASEVLNMLMTEWNWDDALDVRFEEGIELGLERGREQRNVEIALNLKNMGISVEQIVKASGLPIDFVENL